MMSRLISIALPLKGEDPTYLSQSSNGEDTEMNESHNIFSQAHRSAVLEKRMKAMNYIGSLLSQTTVKIDDKFYIHCLRLILERYKQSVRERKEA